MSLSKLISLIIPDQFSSGLSVITDLVVGTSLQCPLPFVHCHLGLMGDLVHVLRLRPVVEERLDLLALLLAHINLSPRDHVRPKGGH